MSTPVRSIRPPHLFRFAVASDKRGWRLAGGASGYAGHQLAEVMVPVVVGVVIDTAIGPGDARALTVTLLLLVLVFCLLVVSWQTADRLVTRVHTGGEHALRQRIVTGLLGGLRVRRAPGEVLTISSTDAASVAGFSWVVAEQAGAAAALIASGVVLASVSWLLVGVVLLCTLAQVTLVHLMSGRLRARSYDAQRRAARIDALGTDFALGLRALEALGATQQASERYRTESTNAARAAYRADRANTALSTANTLASGAAYAAITATAGALALNGEISIGAFVIGVGLAQAIRRPLQIIGYLPGSYAAKHGSATRIGELLTQSDDAAPARRSAPVTLNAPVVLQLGPTRVAVNPATIVGFRIEESAGVDLADLLGARRAPGAHELLIDGHDASTLSADVLRATIFAPPRNEVLFSGSIRDNLRAGVADHDGALAASGLDEVVSRLPNGLDEALGENGARLSGGQRQRALLARALLTDHPVLVLHEPTSAIDPVTEARIARSIGVYLRAQGRAVVFITDSPALLGVCDLIVELPATAERVGQEWRP